MKKIFIFGAGSGSQEVLLAIEQINQLTPTWEVLGFIEKSSELIGTEINGYSVYSLENIDLKPITPVHGVCGVLDSKIRQRIIEDEIEGNNISLATIIHPSSIVPKGLFNRKRVSYNAFCEDKLRCNSWKRCICSMEFFTRT